jgi:hypothetical protein
VIPCPELQCPVVVARIRAKIQRISLSELPDLDILIRSEPTGMRATVTGHCIAVENDRLPRLPIKIPTFPLRTHPWTTRLMVGSQAHTCNRAEKNVFAVCLSLVASRHCIWGEHGMRQPTTVRPKCNRRSTPFYPQLSIYQGQSTSQLVVLLPCAAEIRTAPSELAVAS